MICRLITPMAMVAAAHAHPERPRIGDLKLLVGEGPIPHGFLLVRPGRIRGEYQVEWPSKNEATPEPEPEATEAEAPPDAP